ncbi:hypothetical protein INT47_010042 [Mucor saturninus]|uniref:Nibrin second BRCT domain-containing protein n=1 Tax=Mucor saturninus TaxID=64648 RepID=A0A8H7UU85_9FUNG|nr:hypothetical protein INT47_010042 [Mucor saturninus]
MWLLYSLKKVPDIGFVEQCVSRLRPHQSYVICRKDKYDSIFTATIETDLYPLPEVVDPRSKPIIRLTQTKSNRFEAVVSDNTFKGSYYLHDCDVIRIINKEVRFRIRWEDMMVFKDGPTDDDFEEMVDEAAVFGFHLITEWHKNVTHVWISEEPTEEISTHLLRALMEQKYIVTKDWLVKDFLTSTDRRFLSGEVYDTIKPVVWENFGPLKRRVELTLNDRRLSLFNKMRFIAFDSQQYKRLAPLVSLGGGKVVYHDLSSQNEFKFNPNFILIAPPEQKRRKVQRWEILKERIDRKYSDIRAIEDVEIGFAIIYCSTDYMCNPHASLDSLDLNSVDTVTPSTNTDQDDNRSPERHHQASENNMEYRKGKNKSDHPTCAVQANTSRVTEPYVSSSSSVAPLFTTSKKPSSEANHISPVNPTSTSTPPADPTPPTPVAKPAPPPSVKPTPPTLAAKPTPPPSVKPNFTSPAVNAPSPTNPASSSVASPVNHTSPIGSLSPVGHMSPIEAISPMYDVDEDIPLPSLHNFFDDFVGPLKARPPPKRQTVEASSAKDLGPTTQNSTRTDSAPKTPEPISPRTSSITDTSSTIAATTDRSSIADRSPIADRSSTTDYDLKTGNSSEMNHSTTVDEHGSTRNRDPVPDTNSTVVDTAPFPDSQDSVTVVDQPNDFYRTDTSSRNREVSPQPETSTASNRLRDFSANVNVSSSLRNRESSPQPESSTVSNRFKDLSVDSSISGSSSNKANAPLERTLSRSSGTNRLAEFSSSSDHASVLYSRPTRARGEQSLLSQMVGQSRKRKDLLGDFMNYDDDTTHEPEEEISSKIRYSNVVYASLVVDPPSHTPSPQGTSGGVNYKVFKKRRHNNDEEMVRIVPMVTSEQRHQEQIRDNQPGQSSRTDRNTGMLEEDHSDIDPLLLIPTARRAYR